MSSQKLFCGKRRDTIPPGYSGYDTEYNCLRRGVGVGLSIARNGRLPRRAPQSSNKNIPWWVILLIILLILLVVVIIIILVWRKSSS